MGYIKVVLRAYPQCCSVSSFCTCWSNMLQNEVTPAFLTLHSDSSVSLCEICSAVSAPQNQNYVSQQAEACKHTCEPCIVMAPFCIPCSIPISVQRSGFPHGGFTMCNPLPRCFLSPHLFLLCSGVAAPCCFCTAWIGFGNSAAKWWWF